VFQTVLCELCSVKFHQRVAAAVIDGDLQGRPALPRVVQASLEGDRASIGRDPEDLVRRLEEPVDKGGLDRGVIDVGPVGHGQLGDVVDRALAFAVEQKGP